MPLSEAWREVYRARFENLPLDCGNRDNPGVVYNEDIRDWSDKETTPDQRRIERYIDRYDLGGKRVLHIGIGDSGLAQRFHQRVNEIVGTTIDEPEMTVARSLALPCYSYVLHNKFSPWEGVVEGKFDFILDNNPTSPCCCVRHLAELFDFYEAKLAEGGQIVTDRQGLRWVPQGADPRWGLSFDDLALVAGVAGFSAFRMNKTVYVLSRKLPHKPGVAPLCRHLLTSPKLARKGRQAWPRLTSRYLRRTLKKVLLSTVPWAVPARYRPDK